MHCTQVAAAEIKMMFDDEEDGIEENNSGKKSQKKYLQKYKVEWEINRPWLMNNKNLGAYCKICKKNLDNNVSNLNRHSSTTYHKKRETIVLINQTSLCTVDIQDQQLQEQDMSKWNKSETLLLLTLYEQYPFLYKANDLNYLNKPLRRQKLDDICEELKKVKKDVTVEDIKVKIKTLRSQLRKEKKMIEDSKKNTSSPSEQYVPTLWSYRHIQFLDDSSNDDDVDGVAFENSDTTTTEFVACEELDHEEDASESSFKCSQPITSKRKNSNDFKEEAKKAFHFAKSYAEEILQSRAKRKSETKEEIFTKYLCEQLKLIRSEDTYEDTTWKILQIVREGIKKDRHERAQ